MNARVEELFHEVVDLSPADRARYFGERQVDTETRLEVEALLAFDPGARSFLDRDVRIAASRALPQIEGKGWRAGPYRLLDVIGRGGMGAVYLAERADGEVTQRLAVKLLPPGAGDPQRERFLQERQILASLAHPNIARMLDAGHLASGQPFLAMEYVAGKPIDVFAVGLSVRQKVALFLKVCAAAGYLHRNLVVHRDLKPSNILVTADGEPKLLDFGIAKILDMATDATMTGMRMLTPGYASPEQVMGGKVTTATDIYSLGAVLYLLLTEKHAHEFEDHSPEAIARTVTSREVTRPSHWAPELKGDLESILIKALRKDPLERYGTVEQFADDLEAFLESRTVRARSGNAWYRARKFVRRYWAPVTAGAFVIASLSAGLYVADRQRLVADRQRLVAERRFSELRQLAHQVIFDLHDAIARLPGAIDAQTKLVATATQYLAGLRTDAIRDKQLALEVAESYIQLARIQGVPAWNNLGQYAEAVENLRKAERLLDPIVAADPRNRYAIYLSANAAHDRVTVADAAGQPEEMIAGGLKAQERFDQLVRLGNLTGKEINAATYIYGDLAEDHIRLHRFEDALRYAKAGIEISRSTAAVAGPRAETFSVLGTALKYLGDFQGALEATREARSEWEKYRRYETDLPDHYWPPYARLTLSYIRSREGLLLAEDGGVDLSQPREAAVLLREAFSAVEEDARNEPKDYLSRHHIAESGLSLGNVLRHSSPKQALEVYDHGLMRIREVSSDIHARRQEASLLAASSYAARWLHREGDARDRIDAAFRLLRDTKDYPAEMIKPGSEADNAARALADHYGETGEPNQAIESYRDLRGKILKSNPDAQNDLLNAAQLSGLDATLAGLLRRAGRSEEAAVLDQNRLELWRHWDRKLPNNPFVQRQIAGK
jgi:tetratricopeptide (TPR) repeat protein/predicted Ser/Thr protein kinase